jgi:large subunit ribosomal protein L9
MKVVMIKDVGGVGKRGTLVEVSDGYALNYLIPHRMAEQATAQKESEVVMRMKKEDETREKEASATANVIHGLKGAHIKISAKATEKGGLFKAVSAMDIAKAIMAQRGELLRVALIQLDKPIKTTGDHIVTVKSGDAEAQFTLKVETGK